MQTDTVRDSKGMAVALGCVALGAYVLWEAQEFTRFASVFPRVVAAAMIVFSIGIIVQGLVRRPRSVPEGEVHLWRPVSLIGLLGAWAFLIPHFGFVPASLLGFTGAALLAKYDPWSLRDWAIHAVLMLGIVGGLYALFGWGLRVPFP